MPDKIRLFLMNAGFRSPLYPLDSPPLGALYLAAWLRERFPLDIKIVNQRLDNLSSGDIARLAAAFRADIVGITVMTPSAHLLPSLISGLKSAIPGVKIVLGGPHISASGASVLDQAPADAAVTGEGERSMEMIIDAFQGNGDLGHIPGLIWRNAKGEALTNPGAVPIIEDIDAIPLPAYDLIDPTRYWHHQSMPPIPRRHYISLVSSRGCPYGCIWCHNISGRRFRAHSPERMVEEVMYFKKMFGVDDVEFLDDCFNLQRRRVFDFSEQLLKKNGPIKIAFPNALRADLLDNDTLEALAAAGAYFSSFALETASPRLQEMTLKRLDVPKFLQAVQLAASKNIFTNGFMMLGFPTETKEEMELTIKTAVESDLHTASFFTVTPFPGTALFEYAKKNLPDRIGHIHYEDINFCLMNVNMSDVPDKTLFSCQRQATRNFFLRPRRLYRILRDFPQPHLLPLYIPIVINRALKGLLP